MRADTKSALLINIFQVSSIFGTQKALYTWDLTNALRIILIQKFYFGDMKIESVKVIHKNGLPQIV